MSGDRIDVQAASRRRTPRETAVSAMPPWLLWGIAVVLLAIALSIPRVGLGWQVALVDPDASGPEHGPVTGTTAPESIRVMVGNTAALSNVDLYLAWIDLDAGIAEEDVIRSWIAEHGWAPGIHPVGQGPFDLPPFDPVDLTSLPEVCPEGHRCFLTCLATESGVDPRNRAGWTDLALYPLSQSAARERHPGQVFFASAGEESDRYSFSVQPAAPPGAEGDDTGGGAVTEKPDLVKLEGDRLLYANGQAQRFQVVDLADPSTPFLLGSLSLEASPQEIYSLGGYIYLLQSGLWNAQNGTRISVLDLAEDGTITTLQTLTLPGSFLESRRRDRVIYAVSQENGVPCVGCVYEAPGYDVTVSAIRIGDDGRLSVAEEASLSGYQPVVAIFDDYLVCCTGRYDEWGRSTMHVFDCTDPANPLKPLTPVTVSGWIPSEFHVDVLDDYLRVVYGPDDRIYGSTLAVFDLRAGQNSPEEVGSLSGIAPGEALYATRFVDDRAYVVTYERQDPLWVIDLSDPAHLRILGELEVPGWSEKLFFHGHRLFALGIDDTPVPSDETQWARRVSASLFDVENPAAPSLLDRFTPLAGQVPETYSEALSDERALLLDWDDRYAAFPLEEWYSGSGSHVQILSLAGDKLSDSGMVDTPVGIRRSLELGPGLLTLLGDQELFTVDWAHGRPEILGSIELAANMTWLEWTEEGSLWAASYGRNGLYRLFRFDPADLESPARNWSLTEAYDGALLADGQAVFYDLYPLVIRIVDLESGSTGRPLVLDSADAARGYSLTPFLRQGRFFVAEQVWQGVPSRAESVWYPEPAGNQWILKTWRLSGNNALAEPERSLPGMPVTMMADGRMVCMEGSADGVQLHLVALDGGEARLITSREFPCSFWNSTIAGAGEALYLQCGAIYEGPWPLPLDPIEPDEALPGAEEGGADEANFVASPDSPDILPPWEPAGDTELLKLDPAAGFAELGRWTFTGTRRIQGARDDLVILTTDWWYGGPLLLDAPVDVAAMPVGDGSGAPENQCAVYRLSAGGSEELLEVDSCWDANGIALTPNELFVARGYQGIEAFSW
jgi:hypothetical protein